jgi:pyrrolidone-carboxylate peptidase
MTKKVLVTGYGPFGVYKTNPAWEAVKKLKLPVDIQMVPVEYEAVPKVFEKQYDFYIHVGVGLGDYRLEIRAHNDGYTKVDNLGKTCEQCIVGGEGVLETNLAVDELLEQLDFCTKSIDAGRYLCEFILYYSLHKSKGNSIFIHVPNNSEQSIIDAKLHEIIQVILERINPKNK